MSDLFEEIRLDKCSYELFEVSGDQIVSHAAEALIGLFVVEGRIAVHHGSGVPDQLAEGEFMLLSPRQAYVLRPVSGRSCTIGRVIYCFDTARARLFLRLLPGALVIRQLQPEEIEWQMRLARLIADCNRVAHPANAAINRRLVEAALLGVIQQYLARSGAFAPIAVAADAPLSPSLHAIHRHPERPWTVASLAGLTGMSRTLFAATFAESTGEAPVRYLTRTRMERGRHLLAHSVLSLAEVAHRSGYGTDVAFARAFRRYFGMSPGQFRNDQRCATPTEDHLPPNSTLSEKP